MKHFWLPAWIVKRKLTGDSPPKPVFRNKVNIFDEKTIAEHFNTVCISVGLQLAEKIPF